MFWSFVSCGVGFVVVGVLVVGVFSVVVIPVDLFLPPVLRVADAPAFYVAVEEVCEFVSGGRGGGLVFRFGVFCLGVGEGGFCVGFGV